MATVCACAGFGAVCGSSIATAATMAKVAYPAMSHLGYSDRLSTGTIARGGTLGILIPPSTILVIYGVLTETISASCSLPACYRACWPPFCCASPCSGSYGPIRPRARVASARLGANGSWRSRACGRLGSSSTAAALALRSLCSAPFGPPRLMHRTRRKPLRWSGTQWRRSSLASFDIGLRFRSLNFLDSVAQRQGGLEFSWAAKPETDTFGHEPALVARTCSPANLLGFLKFVGTPRCNDARRCHPCPWHSQGALAAMAWRRTSEQPRRVAICTGRQQRNAGKRAPVALRIVASASCAGPRIITAQK